MKTRIRRTLGSLLLLVLSVAVGLALTEAALRLLGYRGEPIAKITNIYPVDDPVLDWRYVPNSEIVSGRAVYRFNSAGFRDTDHALVKPDGITRIVVVGDSVSEGYEIEWADVFARRLQLGLGDKYEVINVAMGGLNTPQEVHLLERSGLAYRPDLVIVNFVLNDVDFYTRFGPAQRAAAQADSRIAILNIPISPRIKRLLKSSALVYLANDRLLGLKHALTGTTDDRDYFERIWASEANRRKVTDGFAKLAQLQGLGHFEVVIVIWPLLTDYKHYRFESIHSWVREEATKAGLPVIDLLGAFSGTPYRKLQVSVEDAVHPNELGHRLGAEAFLTWYRSRIRPRASRMGPGVSSSRPAARRLHDTAT